MWGSENHPSTWCGNIPNSERNGGEKDRNDLNLLQVSLELSSQGKMPWHNNPRLLPMPYMTASSVTPSTRQLLVRRIAIHEKSTTNSKGWPHILCLSYQTPAHTSPGMSSHFQFLAIVLSIRGEHLGEHSLPFWWYGRMEQVGLPSFSRPPNKH